MSDDGGLGSFSGSLLGAVSMTTIANQILEQARPLLESTLGIDLNVVITFCIFGAMVFAGWSHVDSFVRNTLLDEHYTCHIRVSSEDSVYTALMEYLEENRIFGGEERAVAGGSSGKTADAESDVYPIGKTSKMAWYAKPTRNLEANLDGWKGSLFGDESDSDDESDDDDMMHVKNKKKIKYAPTPGYSHYFYFKPTGHTVTITRSEPADGNPGAWWKKRRELVELSIYGRDTAPLKMLLQRVCDRRNQKDVGRTVVFKATQGMDGGGPGWERCFSRAIRPIQTVVLDESQKDMICSDIAEYLMPATSKWYANRGLPYRRGYLLYGPPGTGKTSLTVALAGKFNLQVYSLSLSATWMNDDILAHLFSRLPRSCIVLLEDVDACGVTRDSDSSSSTSMPTKSTTGPPSSSPADSSSSAKVTFSGLLNAIDGVASKEGRLLIMTTNHRARLDEALIRPGRVDVQVKFSFADRAIVHNLFQALYTVDASDRLLLNFPSDFPGAAELATLAAAFAARVPEGTFSPAEVQGLLLRFKKDPRGAVEGVRDWVDRVEAEKREKERREEERVAREKLAEVERKVADVKELLDNGTVSEGALTRSLTGGLGEGPLARSLSGGLGGLTEGNLRRRTSTGGLTAGALRRADTGGLADGPATLTRSLTGAAKGGVGVSAMQNGDNPKEQRPNTLKRTPTNGSLTGGSLV